MTENIVWAAALSIVAVSVAYCTVEVSRMRNDARASEAAFCATNGGVWTYGWGNPWCNYAKEPLP